MNIFALLCILFLFGCFCGIEFATINILFLIIAVCLIFAIKLIIFKTKTYINFCVLAVIIVFCMGSAFGAYHEYKTFSKVYPLCGMDITLRGTVTDVEEKNFVVDTDIGNVTAYNYIYKELNKGDTVEISGTFSVYETAQYNGDFDRRHHYAVYGIVGYVECDSITVTGHIGKFSLWDMGSSLREKIRSIINETQVSERSKGFVTALLTGDSEYMTDDVKKAFSITGTSHVTAVSGLHVSIFLSFFILFSKGLRKNKIANALLIIILVVMYTLFIGERASVLRAGIMTVFGYCVFAMRRRSDPLINLVIAGLIICFVNPYYVVSPGFQMSFLATLGLVIFAEHFEHQIVAVPVIATLFMLPVTLYYYGTFSLTTVFANLIVVFLIPFVILMGYIGCFVPYFMYSSFAIAEFVIIIVKLFASMEFLHFTVPATNVPQFVMFFLTICGAYFAFAKKMYRRMFLMLFMVVAIYLNGIFTVNNIENSATVKFINSGNYNMHHITTENGNEIFIDCGSDTYEYATKCGIDGIFAVIITDTSEKRYSGLEELCDGEIVKYIVLPNELKDKNFHLENCDVLYYNQNDYKFHIDNVNFRFYSKDGEKSLLIQIYNNVIAIPLDKTVADIKNCTVLSVPDKCKDCNIASHDGKAQYFIHPTYRYGYYDNSNKYITSQVGMVSVVFKEGKKPGITVP